MRWVIEYLIENRWLRGSQYFSDLATAQTWMDERAKDAIRNGHNHPSQRRVTQIS